MAIPNLQRPTVQTQESAQATLFEQFSRGTFMNEQDNLRDFFAGLSLPGLVTKAIELGHDSESIAKSAFNIADAMLKQRQIKPEIKDDKDGANS